MPETMFIEVFRTGLPAAGEIGLAWDSRQQAITKSLAEQGNACNQAQLRRENQIQVILE